MTVPTAETEIRPRGWLRIRWLRFALAVTFLTRLPLPVRGPATPEDLRASMGWYPVIGLGLGALGAGAFALARAALPELVAAALVIILLEVLTGVLHLDGLMDTCDGMGSGAPRERALEIMRDSRAGPMGVLGAIAVTLLKVAALAALTPARALLPLAAGWAAARAAPAWDVLLFPYARAEGTGAPFSRTGGGWMVATATLAALTTGFWLGHLQGLLLAALAILLPLLAQLPVARKLGGLTGDVYGFGIELGETVALLLAAGFVR